MNGIIAEIDRPLQWTMERFDRVTHRVQEAGRIDLPFLSVFLDEGVVLRESREDNYNRLGADTSNYLAVRPGDVVFNKLRTWQGGIGVSRFDGRVSPAYFVCRPSPRAEPRFLHYLLRSSTYLQEFTRISKQMPPAQFDIGWNQLRTLPILVPPLHEQRAIADFLDRETARIDALITKKRRMANILDEKFRGRLDLVFERIRASEVPLGRFVTGFTQGVSPQAEDRPYGPGEWGMLKLSAVKFGRYIPGENKTLPPGFKIDPSLIPRRDELLITRSNTPGYVGDVCVVLEEDPQVLIPDLIYRARLDGRVSAEYAAYSMLTTRARHHLGGSARGTSQSMVKLRGEDVRATRIPWTTRDEQHRVVRDLNMLRGQIDATRRKLISQINLLCEHRQALITGAVTGDRDPCRE